MTTTPSSQRTALALLLSLRLAAALITSVDESGRSRVLKNGIEKEKKFYSVRKDFRRCAFPMCGGWLVKAVNEKSTTCFDGTKADECYVAKIEFEEELERRYDTYTFKKSRANLAVARSYSKYVDPNFGEFGVLQIEEAWYGADTMGGKGHPGPEWSVVVDNGLRCGKEERCFFRYEQQFLNDVTDGVTMISGVDLDGVRPTKEELEEARAALKIHPGLYIGGENVPAEGGEEEEGITVVAQQFYLPLPELENKGSKKKNKKKKKKKKSKDIFFSARRDYRECAPPMCGGWFVKATNEKSTLCPDGTAAEECYVAKINFRKLDLKDSDKTKFLEGDTNLALGRLKTMKIKGASEIKETFGVLIAKGLWYGAGDTSGSSGHPGPEWSLVVDNGIRCIWAPCYSFHQEILNTGDKSDISNINLSKVDAPKEAETLARYALGNDGLYVGGKNILVKEQGGPGESLEVEQYYLPFLSENKKSKGKKSKSEGSKSSEVGGREVCGDIVCPKEKPECCNESCKICAEVGGWCIQRHCDDRKLTVGDTAVGTKTGHHE